MSLCRTLLVVLGLTMLIGLVISEEPLEVRSNGIQFSFEDSISGSGNFASNNKLVAQGPHADPRELGRLADVVLQEKNHGSGSIERDVVINSNKLIKIQIAPDVIYAYGLIAALDNHSSGLSSRESKTSTDRSIFARIAFAAFARSKTGIVSPFPVVFLDVISSKEKGGIMYPIPPIRLGCPPTAAG